MNFMLVSGMTTTLCGQNDVRSHQQVDLTLVEYADSLKRLLLGHRTSLTLHLADSLLELNKKVISSEVIQIKAAKANAYELLYNFEAALEIYNELTILLETHEFVEDEIDVLLSLARVYEWVDKPDLCQQSLDKAFELINSYDHPEKLSRYFVRSASYQRIFKDREVAREYALKGVQLGEQYNVARSVADGNLILGTLTNDIEESISHFEKASSTFYALGDYIGSNFQNVNIARKHIENRNYEEALSIVEKVEKFSETIDDNQKIYYQFKIRLSSVSEKLFEAQGEKDSVIVALKQNSRYSKLLGDIINQEKINQLVFENIIRQEKDKVKYITNLNWFLAVGILCLLGILFLLTNVFLKNKKQKQEIQRQSEMIESQYHKTEQLYKYQTTLLSEVHHRIKNNLQLIISLLTLQKAKSIHEDETEMLDTLNHRISSISLIHEQLYNTKEFDKVDVELYVQDLLKNFLSLLSQDIIKIEYEIDDIQLNLETITPLGLIWSELISNSLKYNKDRSELKIFFNLVKEGDTFQMHYHDNGRGYSEGQFESNQKGMGYIIIQSLSKQLAAQIKSYNDGGAHYLMRFKEKIISAL